MFQIHMLLPTVKFSWLRISLSSHLKRVLTVMMMTKFVSQEHAANGMTRQCTFVGPKTMLLNEETVCC